MCGLLPSRHSTGSLAPAAFPGQTIDRLKINANHENKDVRIQHTLREMGKPKKFDLKNGNTVSARLKIRSVHTHAAAANAVCVRASKQSRLPQPAPCPYVCMPRPAAGRGAHALHH